MNETKRLLGKQIAEERRRTRVMYFRIQKSELEMWAAIYKNVVKQYDLGYADLNGMGREFYLIRLRMITNELRNREVGP
jgi:hypothetical protein